jgi:hypothetical protein
MAVFGSNCSIQLTFFKVVFFYCFSKLPKKSCYSAQIYYTDSPRTGQKESVRLRQILDMALCAFDEYA